MGLLGSMIAGGVKGYANQKVADIQKQEEYDLKRQLLQAEYEKNIMLKKAGVQIEQEAKQAEMDRRAGYLSDVKETTKTPESVMNKYTDENGNEVVTKSGGETVEKTRPATMQDAAERAVKAGDFEAGEGLLKLATKKEKTFDSIKLDDGSIFAFDKSTGTGKIVLEGGGKLDVPKNEYELAYKATGGDPVKMGEYLVNQKARIAAAGRAPQRASDEDMAYSDWKRKPENKNKGRDDFAKEKASWGKKAEDDVVEITEKKGVDELGKPINERTEKRKVPASKYDASKKEADPLGLRR